jgi:hypothetical protein
MRLPVLAMSFVVVGAVFACGKSGGGGGGGGSGTMVDGPPMGVITDGPPLVGMPFMLTYPDIQVTAGEENTQCIWMKLSNTTPIKVHQVMNVLSTSSHHLIVYKDDQDTTEQTTPVNCQPFSGALNATGKIEPIVITQKKMDEVTLPDGVAYTLAPNQMIRLEMHYINTTEMTQTANATATFYAADPATIQFEAGILFNGTPDVSVPANQQTSLHEYLSLPSYIDLSQAHIFAITGHEHHLGTGVVVNVAGGSGSAGPLTNVYNPTPFLWAEPATETFSTPFSIPQGGGWDFTCTWNNTT